MHTNVCFFNLEAGNLSLLFFLCKFTLKGDYLNKKIDNKKLELKKRKKEQFLTNALKIDTFNGRRYLGTSKFG